MELNGCGLSLFFLLSLSLSSSAESLRKAFFIVLVGLVSFLKCISVTSGLRPDFGAAIKKTFLCIDQAFQNRSLNANKKCQAHLLKVACCIAFDTLLREESLLLTVLATLSCVGKYLLRLTTNYVFLIQIFEIIYVRF